MPRGRQFVSRLRTRLFGAPPSSPPLGQAWCAAIAEVWPELADQVDAHLKRPGTAAVSTWEVCAADLARVLIGEAEERALLERFSDALVPTLDALQAPHKSLPAALAEGLRAGTAVGTLAAATRPLVLLPNGLDAALAEGWAKTAAFLEPVIVGARDAEAVRAALATTGAKLAAGARDAEAALRADLSLLPPATDPLEGLLSPFERWADVLSRSIEMEAYAGAHGLIRNLR